MSDTSLLIRNAQAILTGLDGEAMRHDVARLGGDLRVRGSHPVELRHRQP